jgi:dihydroorotase
MNTQRELSGNVVFPDGKRPARIIVDAAQGSIVSVENLDQRPDGDLLVFPGFIDAHVHAREFPRPSDADARTEEKWLAACRKETFSSAGFAAINGGVTLFAAMPNDLIPPDNPAAYTRKQDVASSSTCPVIVFAAITPQSEPWADVPYKVYLDMEPSSVNFAQWSDLETALARYRGCRVFFHAEDPDVLRASGKNGPRWLTRTPEAEVSAVEKILEFTAKFGLQTHICHVSTENSVERILEYNRSSGDRVTCEVTPHHLFFSVAQGRVRSAAGSAILAPELLESNPPLRSEHDRRYLIAALKEGLVDMVASDHAPHTLQDKKNGAPGMPHLDTLGSFAGWLIHAQGFLPGTIARILSSEPARLFAADLDRPHGRVESGAVASFTVLHLSEATVVTGSEIEDRGPLRTSCGWSPFDGIPLPARVTGTIIHGKEFWF